MTSDWTRVANVCRKLADLHGIDLPDEIFVVSGDIHEREARRYAALAQFLEAVAAQWSYPSGDGDESLSD